MYFKRGPRCRGPPCKIYPLLLFQLVIRGDAGLVKNRIMYAPDINGRRLFSACLRREGGRGRARRWTGGGIKAGFLRRGKRWGEAGNGVEISKAFPFLCRARSTSIELYIFEKRSFSPDLRARSISSFFLFIYTYIWFRKGLFFKQKLIQKLIFRSSDDVRGLGGLIFWENVVIDTCKYPHLAGYISFRKEDLKL